MELIDREGLRSVENEEGMPDYLKSLDNNACALLVETAAPSKKELDRNIQSVINSISVSDTISTEFILPIFQMSTVSSGR